LLPALSLLPLNCVASCELWAFFKRYDFKTRFRLFYRWKVHDRYPEVNLVRAHTANEIKKILRYVGLLVSLLMSLLGLLVGLLVSLLGLLVAHRRDLFKKI